MVVRTRFLAIEGIDGAGKHTQVDLLTRLLRERGVPHVRFSFPRYDSFFGRLVARYLNGEFGPLASVDPHFSALLYAGDRLEVRPELEAALAEGKLVLADRYIGSNLAHQTARVPTAQRAAFLAWLRQLEYDVYRLPKEDIVVCLRLPATEAQRLVGRKAERNYTSLPRDLQEADLHHLEQAATLYDELAREPNWVTVECFDAAAGCLRRPEEIHRALVAAVEQRAAYLLQPARKLASGNRPGT